MKQHFFLALITAATILMVGIPVLAQTQTPISELHRPNNATVSGRVVSVVGNNFTLGDGTPPWAGRSNRGRQ